MASRSFVLWLHGLGSSGLENEPIKTHFDSPELKNSRWSFPSAPNAPVSCNNGMIMPSWFDIQKFPIRAEYVSDEAGVMTAVETVHAIIDGEISAGTDPKNIFVCGISQGGALALASVLLFPRTLGGGAVLSGWVPFSSSVIGRVTSDAKKTPILWLHGMADELVLFSAGQAGSVFLKQAGMKCEFKGFANLGHIINDEEIFTLESWIKCRIRSSSSIWSFLTCFR
ncbi:putative carboxylesterase Os04g0669500 isoform X2 [Wolffia australiana]